MFMTGFVVLLMSSCHLKQCHICIKNVITEQMTLNDSCHKHAKNFLHMSSHDYESVMLVLCTPLQVVLPINVIFYRKQGEYWI